MHVEKLGVPYKNKRYTTTSEIIVWIGASYFIQNFYFVVSNIFLSSL